MTTTLLNPDDDEGDFLADLIRRCNSGDAAARKLLIELFFQELRRMAEVQLRLESSNHTLRPAALVREVFARLMRQGQFQLNDRSHFLTLAAQLMRKILIDHARERRAAAAAPYEAVPAKKPQTLDVLVLDESLKRLETLDKRQSEIAEMYLFGGLTFQEIAAKLGLSERTVKRDWKMAAAWLRNQLSSQP